MLPLPYRDVNRQLSIRQFKATLQDVIHTASYPHLSESHAAAACDTLRGCLAQCEHSDDPNLRAVAFSQKTWTNIFDIYLSTSKSRKPKPLKLLLVALERNWVKNPSQYVKDALIAHIVSRTWQIVSLKDGGNSAIKPALQALRHFLSKIIVRARDIVLIISQELKSKTVDGTLSPDAQKAHSLENLSLTSRYIEISHHFLCRILRCVPYPDVAPITARLIGVFCSSLRAWQSSWEEPVKPGRSSHDVQSIWLSALKASIQEQPEILDLFAIHVFPEILRQDRSGITDFAEVLSLKHLSSSDIITHGSADLHITLLLLHAVKGKGTSQAIGADTDTIEGIATGLLCHADSQIRQVAFSLAIQSTSPKVPFTKTVLSSLLYVVPDYHEEVDSKSRQDNLAMIKRLCLRLTRTLGLSSPEIDLWTTKPMLERGGPLSKILTASKLEGDVFGQHLAFLVWYLDFLLQELKPTASYQRHVVALKVIEFLFSSETSFLLRAERSSVSEGQRAISHSSFYHDLLTSLLGLVLDPFDDIRGLAASILQNVPRTAWASLTLRGMSKYTSTTDSTTGDCSSVWNASLPVCSPSSNAGLILAWQRAAKRAWNTARADHSDGYGRLCNLVVSHSTLSDQEHAWSENDQLALVRIMAELDDGIEDARRDLYTAVKTASLHSLLIAARYRVLRYNHRDVIHGSDAAQYRIREDIIDRLLRIASDVWMVVRDVLCADAPEGHELGSPDDEASSSTKDVLSFCWRALKESSTLIYSMIVGSKSSLIIQAFQHRHYRTFGDLVFTELAELRHRGAFSTVSQTFAECCARCVESDNPETQALPKEWYQKTLLCIQQRASALTRRSAGLPAMITGILSATPKGDFFNTVIQDLQAVARTAIETDSKDEHMEMPQVHAFNCLKDIFTDARFNICVEQHMSASLEIAIRGLDSNRWAIRNCGLMLMKALITRLNDGTNTLSSKTSSSHRHVSTLVYDKYPNVPDLLLRLLTYKDALNNQTLEQEVTVADTLVIRAQRVFPALEIIEQSGIPKRYHLEIRQASWSHLEGPVWAIRDKAAKSLSYLPQGEAITVEVKRCLQSPWSTQNALHGRLLYVQYLVARLKSDSEGLHTVLNEVFKQFQLVVRRNRCPITRSAYVTLAGDILEASRNPDSRTEPFALKEKQDPKSRTSLVVPDIFASYDWRDFTLYLYQGCLAESAFALESASKYRCRLLLEALQNNKRLRSTELDVSQTTLADLGTGSIPQHPEHADRMLRNTGIFLAARSRIDRSSSADCETVSSWCRALKLAQEEHAEVSTRQAAIDSLSEYFDMINGTNVDSNGTSENPHLLLAVYNSLLDDDEGVRDRGAATISKLLVSLTVQDNSNVVQIPLMVPAARHRLLDFLKDRYRKSSTLWMEAVQRLVGKQPSRISIGSPAKRRQTLHLSSPHALLEKLRPEDTTLFVEEKQNLYIDEAQEAAIWAEVLMSLDHTAIEHGMLRKFETWTTEGIDALTKAAEAEVDGPLGWTTKPEVFTLGARILHAAQVLLRLSENPYLGVDPDTTRRPLEKLMDIGEEYYLNPAWMRVIRKALD
ncbi:MAG: hypothetical protein Q9209_000235 [Squamulea sp. 1 TL-2023]